MATSLTTFQQPVFLSEADRKRLEDMEAQRLAYNTALETYNAKLAEMEAQRLAYNRDLEAYKATFVPGANAGEVALVQRINGQLYDAAGNILPPDTQYSSQAGLPENVFVRRTGGKLGEADAAAMSRYQQALNTYNQQLAQYKDYSSSFLLGKDYQPVKVKDFTRGRLPAAQKYYSIAGPTGSVADVLNAPAGATPSFFMKEPGVPRGYAPGDMFEFVQTGTEPDPYGISRTGDPVGYLRVRRDGGFTSADPSSFAVRTAPTEPVMPQAQYVFPSQPTLPYKETDIPTAPKQPFTEAEFTQAQEESQERAKQAAGQRAVALQAFEDPSRFGLSGFSALSGRSFAKGGEVNEGDPKTKSGKMMKELGFSKPPKERTLADEPSRQSPESLAYSLRAQAEGNKDRDLRRKTLSAPGALEVKRFEEGGEARSKDRDDVSRETFEDVTFFKQSQPLPGQPEHERVRSDTLGFIKRMDDRSVMVAASKMSGMPVESPTQARVMLEQLLGGDASVSAGVMGSGRVLPDRVTGYSVGARMPAFGGQLNVGADIPRGQGRPMFNVGYRKEFQDGGEVMSPEEQPVVEESKASQALKELIRPVREGVKGYFGMDPESSGSEAYRTGQALSNMPGAGAPATLGIFIGKSSKLWNKAMNEAARKMEKSGAPPEEIWRKTGNFKGPDDQWRQEISDLGATQRMQVSQGPASMVLQHPELYQNYPDMKDLLIRTDPYAVRSSYTGSGVPGAEEISLGTAGGKLENIRGLLHEMQHGIQFREGFGLGGSKITAFNDPKAFEILEMVRKRVSTPATLEEFAKGAYQTTKITPKIEDEYKNLYLKNYAASLKSGGLDRMAQEEAARIYYNRLLGETEARAVEDRRLFTPEQRLEVFPTKSYKVDGKPVALEDLIIKRPMERAKGGPVNKHDAFIKAHA